MDADTLFLSDFLTGRCNNDFPVAPFMCNRSKRSCLLIVADYTVTGFDTLDTARSRRLDGPFAVFMSLEVNFNCFALSVTVNTML